MSSILQKTNYLLLLLLFSTAPTFAQSTTVHVNLNMKHKVGDISAFDRKKFVVLHSSLTESDWTGEEDKMEYVLNDLDVYLGRDNGSMGWYMNQATEHPSKPGYVDPNYAVSQGKYVRETVYGVNNAARHKYEDKVDVLVGGQERPFWPGQETNPCCGGTPWAMGGSDASGDFMGQYFNEFYRNEGEPSTKGLPRPRFMEIINEPLYELIDGHPGSTVKPIDVFNYHNEVADAIRRHNSDIMIGGYTTAFPYFDENNFQRWEDRMKLFMDVSGEKMDFFSIHLYDFNKHHYNNGTAFHGPINFKGSRTEATLDMMEQYSQMKFGTVKPFLISEFGGRDHSIEWKEWTPIRDWQFMKAISPMMMQFMERPNNMLKIIPFIVNKAEWGRTGVPYPWRLMRQAKEGAGETGEEWVFTEMIKLYELWSDVKGTRVDSRSSGLDIMTDTYVDGNKAYVILSNLNYNPESIMLNLFGNTTNSVVSIESKQLRLEGNAPVLETKSLTPGQSLNFTLDTEATAILEYTFASNVTVDEVEEEVKYYADTYLKPIQANTFEKFQINNVVKGNFNSGILRIGIGRGHDKSKLPRILFNGKSLPIVENHRGDDQELRNQFFGMLEIKVPDSLLQTNNEVAINFIDDGGHISTVTMQVFSSTVQIDDPTPSDPLGVEDGLAAAKLIVYPNPSKGEFTVNFSEAMKEGSIHVFNINGSKILTEKVAGTSHTLNLTGRPKGIYFISLDSSNLTLRKKIILN
ncbi:T9SS type A sorting domain-containing protein [Flammeovirgaceae bacterium SG7u.111]|nr:T9SS type A sorting domain-containing protein [Flammeovirgaceae bacterium SG7u.132]WPO37252.1 T9SS type A sorting domain-containing protein [Flammeovirgaceae bacterium SG7u.111]